MEILTATVTATIGVWIASCGLIGYMLQPLKWVMRFVLFASAIPYGVLLNLVGLGIGALVLGYEFTSTRRLKAVG